MSSSDYGRFAEAAPAPEKVASLSAAAQEMYEAEMEVLRCEQQLKDAQARLRDVSEKVLPDMMEDAGMSELVLSNGTRLKVEDKLTVTPLKANRPAVIEWLRTSGHGSKVKRNVIVSLGKDADERERALLAELESEGFRDHRTEEWVEPSTLRAHVKRALEAGEEVDMELLNARLFKRAKITGKPKDGSSAFGE